MPIPTMHDEFRENFFPERLYPDFADEELNDAIDSALAFALEFVNALMPAIPEAFKEQAVARYAAFLLDASADSGGTSKDQGVAQAAESTRSASVSGMDAYTAALFINEHGRKFLSITSGSRPPQRRSAVSVVGAIA